MTKPKPQFKLVVWEEGEADLGKRPELLPLLFRVSESRRRSKVMLSVTVESFLVVALNLLIGSSAAGIVIGLLIVLMARLAGSQIYRRHAEWLLQEAVKRK